MHFYFYLKKHQSIKVHHMFSILQKLVASHSLTKMKDKINETRWLLKPKFLQYKYVVYRNDNSTNERHFNIPSLTEHSRNIR